MAQLDANIFLQQQGPDLGKLGEGFERGMRLGDMMRENKMKQAEMQKQADIKDAFNNAYDVKEDGSRVFNPMKVGELVRAKGYTQDGFKIDQDMQAQQAAQLKTGLETNYNQNAFVTSLLGTVKDQASYDSAKMQAKAKGIPGVDQLPLTYDARIIDGLRNQYGKASMSYKDILLDSRQREEAQARLAELGIRRQERKDTQDQKNEEKELALTTPYGLANTVEDAKIIKDAHQQKKDLFDQIDGMITLREKYGGGAIMEPEDQEVAKQLSNDALLAYKNLKKLGVLSQSDEAIVNAIIPKDPLRLRSIPEVATGQDSTLARLKNFRKDKSESFAEGIRARIRNGEQAAQKFEQNEGVQKTGATPEKKFKWQVVD